MKELIKVDFSADRLTVSARDLHGFIGVETPYHKWFPRMCEYGFTEGVDYSVMDIFVHHSQGGSQSKKDAALTIDMAKEICMLQRNEKGKQARQYFIQLEKDWNSPEKVMARALKIADAKIKTLEEANAEMKAKIDEDAPKVQYADMTAGNDGVMLIREFCKCLRQQGCKIGEKRMFSDLREKGFLIKDGRAKNRPTQRAMGMGLFAVRQNAITTHDGTFTTSTTLLTEKGKRYFTNMYLGKTA